MATMKVKKEITVAIFIGLIIGAIIMGGVFRARRALVNLNPNPNSSATPLPSGKQPVESGLYLELTTADNQVLESPSMTISGKTVPKSYIVINGEAGDYIIVPNDLGNFSQEINLVQGANTILVTVYLEDGTKTESTINAIYTSEI